MIAALAAAVTGPRGRWVTIAVWIAIGVGGYVARSHIGGNTAALVAGNAFSIEPGIYPGGHGARIEDIVVCTKEGVSRLNHQTRDLVVVAP